MFGRLAQLIRERDQRFALLMRLGLVKGAFQASADTAPNRYQAIFDAAQSILGADRALNLLSFGCASGDEVFNLRRRFSNATVRGLDINPGNIAVGRKRLRELGMSRVSFARASSTAGEPANHYDALFCMAVLRDGRLAEGGRYSPDCSARIRFRDFARHIEDFHRRLKPGGLLILRHSNFRLCDTALAPQFETVYRQTPQDRTPVYGPDHRLLPSVVVDEVIFRKRGAG